MLDDNHPRRAKRSIDETSGVQERATKKHITENYCTDHVISGIISAEDANVAYLKQFSSSGLASLFIQQDPLILTLYLAQVKKELDETGRSALINRIEQLDLKIKLEKSRQLQFKNEQCSQMNYTQLRTQRHTWQNQKGKELTIGEVMEVDEKEQTPAERHQGAGYYTNQ